MSIARQLDRLVPDLSATLIRFPVPALLSLALFAYAQARLPDLFDDEGARVVLALSAAFFGAGAAHLFGEGRGLTRITTTLVAALVAVIVAALSYFSGYFATNALFLFSALILVVMVAPYLRHGSGNAAIWLFNLRFGLAALLAVVVALVFALGLSGIVETLHLLFGVGMGKLHERIWSTAMALIAPLYALSLMPRDLDEPVAVEAHKGSLLDRGVSVLVNYVAVPVAFIYAVILHAYAVKIVIDGELPQGQIATMVSIFAVGGTVTWLVAWPWRDSGTRLLRFFMRYWFFGLVVPAVMLVAAIWRRLTDYGVTPDRYGIAAVAVWVAALVLYLAIRRNRADMRAIIGAAAVLLLVGAAGPWGANGTTIASQFGRLVALLDANGLLKDGRIDAGKKVGSDMATSGYSMIYALRDVGGLDRLRPLFDGHPDDPFAGSSADNDWSLSQAIAEQLGFTTAQVADYVYFNANLALEVPMPPGTRLFGPFTALPRYGAPGEAQDLTAIIDETHVRAYVDGATYSVAQRDLLETVKARQALNQTSQGVVTVSVTPNVDMLIDQANGNLGRDRPLDSLRFWLIRRPAP
jgi:hypothetical protein